MLIVYAFRWTDGYTYHHKSRKNKKSSSYWLSRYKISIYLVAIGWASLVWIAYPSVQPAYQALFVLILGGIIIGSAAITECYERATIAIFQGSIFASLEVRLLIENEPFSQELAIVNLLLFGFLLYAARKININFYNSFVTKTASDDTNLAMIKSSEEMANIGYWKWDMHSRKIELSSNLARIWGYSENELDMLQLYDLMHNDDWKDVRQVINSTLKGGGEASVEYRILNIRTGNYLAMNQVSKRVLGRHGMDYMLGTVQDISDIKSAKRRLYDIAYYDGLTNLANRAHFHEHLKKQIKSATPHNEKFAILYIDLDDFKEINDSFGHDSGDMYLKRFSYHLKKQLRTSDFISRIGGDEFCVVLHNVKDDEEIIEITKRCQAFMQQSIKIENHHINPKMSIGISVFPDHGNDVDDLLCAADLAMFTVKHNGKHDFAFYSAQMQFDKLDRLKLEGDLRHAIDNNEFELWYQPKISLENNNLDAVEALIRWHHPTRGLVRPDLFIGLAEQVGVIDDIGCWVLKTASKQLQSWKSQGIKLCMAVNISSGHFESAGFVNVVKENIAEFGLEANELEIEITESMTRNHKRHVRICHQLRKEGIRIAIDDFGTGYSSLSVLTQLEVDTLKIDRSFIMGLPQDKASALMVRTIIDLSKGLGFDIVAEGVESFEQLQLVKSMGCHYVQGYYFSKPVTADKIPPLTNINWMQQNSVRAV